jgi:hypothetical protein
VALTRKSQIATMQIFKSWLGEQNIVSPPVVAPSKLLAGFSAHTGWRGGFQGASYECNSNRRTNGLATRMSCEILSTHTMEDNSHEGRINSTNHNRKQ